MKEVQKIKFDCNGNNAPAYGCDKPCDNSGVYVKSTDYDELLRERNELAAQVERLRGVLEGVTKVEHKRGGSLGSDGQFYYRVGERQFSKIESALSETPAQSLDAVKREWLVESFSKIEANMNDIAAEANEESNVMLQSSALFAAEVMRRHSVRLKP